MYYSWIEIIIFALSVLGSISVVIGMIYLLSFMYGEITGSNYRGRNKKK